MDLPKRSRVCYYPQVATQRFRRAEYHLGEERHPNRPSTTSRMSPHPEGIRDADGHAAGLPRRRASFTPVAPGRRVTGTGGERDYPVASDHVYEGP